MSSFLAKKKLAALQAAKQRQQQHGAGGYDRDEMDDDHQGASSTGATVVAEPQRKKTKTTTTTAAVVVSDDDSAELVSDATAAEQAMLAAMFPSSFGAAAKPAADPSAVHEHRARKQEVKPEAKVKLEGALVDAPMPPPQQAAIRPKKVAVPIAPAALLGGAYDSSDDDEDAAASGVAAASSSAVAAASSAAAAVAAMSDEDEESSEDEDESSGRARNPLLRSLPISHEAELRTNGHTKSVSALCVDRSGGRVLSGGYDYQAKQWDFGGMNESLAAFRTFEPQEGHQVRQLTYSNTGDMFLAVTGGAQPKIYTRDAVEVCQLARGDMYLMDQKATKGHSTAVTSGWWHPTDRNMVITSGIDGTVRVWDVNKPENNLSVIKPRGFIRGVAVSTTAFSKDGKIIATACTDGSIHLIKHSKGREYRDDKVLADAHVKGSETTCLLFASDGHTLYSRGGDSDHTLKQWDIRAFRQPVHIVGDLENAYPETDIALSPDERVLVTGTSSRDPNAAPAQAVFIERATMRPIQRVSMAAGCKGLIRTVWHAGINQLLFGCSDGAIRLLYDPQLSTKGVLMCLGRKMKAKAASDYTDSVGEILTPHALPSLRGPSTNRKRAREKTAESLAPEAPVQGRVGVGGRAAGSQSMAAFHLSKYVAMREDPRAKDPREALLAMDDLAKKDPIFFNSYNKTQPVPIFAEVPEDERQVEVTQAEINLANKREGQTS